jgi:hypothetical protein
VCDPSTRSTKNVSIAMKIQSSTRRRHSAFGNTGSAPPRSLDFSTTFSAGACMCALIFQSRIRRSARIGKPCRSPLSFTPYRDLISDLNGRNESAICSWGVSANMESASHGEER